MDRPLSVTPVTEEEVSEFTLTRVGGRFGWRFPDELFDGQWWAIEVPKNRVNSATNSFRNQCEAVYGTRASVRRGTDGRVFVKRLVDEPKEYRGTKRRKPSEAKGSDTT